MILKYILRKLYSVFIKYSTFILMILSIYSSLKIFITLLKNFIITNEDTIIYKFFNLSLLSIIQNASLSYMLYFTILSVGGSLTYLLPKFTKFEETYLLILLNKFKSTYIVISVLFFFLTTFNDIQLGIIASSLSIYAIIINVRDSIDKKNNLITDLLLIFKW